MNMSEAELFKRIDNDQLESEKITAPRYSYWQSVFRVFFRKKINIVILSLLAFVFAFTYIYPMVIGYDASVNPFINLMDSGSKHLKPSAALAYFGNNIHWILGSGDAGQSTFDSIWYGASISISLAMNYLGNNIHWILGSGDAGQSTFDAVWYGASISVSLAMICAVINMFIGIVIGAIWGFSKKVDVFMTEVYNVIANVPYVLLISVIVLILSPSFWAMVFALTITGWIGIAYFIRTQVIIIRDREYNLASRCLGTPLTRIATKNILPFMTSVIVTMAATEIPSYISYEVFLSYIGIGLTDMSLGKLIQMAQGGMMAVGGAWPFWGPVAVASTITVVLHIVGQNLGDASDPRTHM